MCFNLRNNYIILSVAIYIVEYKQYKIHVKYHNVIFMNQHSSKFKFWIPKEFMKIFNNTFGNKFNNLKDFKKNTIKLDDCFSELNINLKIHYIHSIQNDYMFAKSREFISDKSLMENIQYNNIQKKYIKAILINYGQD